MLNQYQSYTPQTGYGPSPGLWAPFDETRAAADPTWAMHVFDNFIRSHGTLTFDSVSTWGGYRTFANTGSTLLHATSGQQPVSGVVLTTSSLSGDTITLVSPLSTLRFSGNSGVLYFEAAVAFRNLAANTGWFIGLMTAESLAADVPLSNSSSLADVNLIGFIRPGNNPSTINTVHRKAGSGAVTSNSGWLTGMVADQVYKLGLKFDPNSSSVTFYLNGVPRGSTVDTTASTFPSGAGMGMVFSGETGSTTSTAAELRWWRAAQVIR